VFVGLLSMASGFRLVLQSTGDMQNAIVLQKGSQSEITSSFSQEAGDSVAVDDRIAQGPDGRSLASPALVTVVALPRRSDGVFSNVTIRGVTPSAFLVHKEVRIVEGRSVQPGLYEVLVGKRTLDRIRGLAIGSNVTLMKRDFAVVGVFSADGDSYESEIWGDLSAMASAFGRPGIQNSITVRLVDPQKIKAFDAELRASPRFDLEMKSERLYYEEEAGPFAKFLRGLALFVSVVMGIGAVFGAMNTMYAIVASRTREIGTLRALGFARHNILVAFVVEAVCLATIGGILGCALSFVVNGMVITTSTNMSEVAFAFQVTTIDLANGLIFATSMGLIGGLLPAVRAARLPIVRALREQ
jgi:putative ABC transport system permease protein